MEFFIYFYYTTNKRVYEMRTEQSRKREEEEMEKLHAFKKNFIEIGFFFSFVVVVLLAVERNGF